MTSPVMRDTCGDRMTLSAMAIDVSSDTGSNAVSQTVTRRRGRGRGLNGQTSNKRSGCYSSPSLVADDGMDMAAINRHVDRELTPSSPPCRHSEPSATLPAFSPLSQTQPSVAIPFPADNKYHTSIYQDVRPLPVNGFASRSLSQPIVNEHGLDYFPLESFQPSSSAVPIHQNAPLNNYTPRLRTSAPVFTSTSDLAAHYGIPQFLPPAPRIKSRRPSDSTTAELFSDEALIPQDFSSVCSNYLTMLSQKPNENVGDHGPSGPASSAEVPALHPVSSQDCAVQDLWQVLQASLASPIVETFETFGDYLTSPFDDSPIDDLLTTPAHPSGTLDADIMTSPIMDGIDSAIYNDSPLFSDTPGMDFDLLVGSKGQKPVQPQPDLDAMYTMPTPETPSLDPSSLHASPHQPSENPPPNASMRRRTSANGTRKNITPGALVPVDAPTQPRKYVTPSATSRKEVPAVFARKRARTQAPDDDDDFDEIVKLPPDATEQQLIEAKRRQNTIAARRSRKRKLEYQRELEDNLDRLKDELDAWKTRALTSEALLQSHGISIPTIPPS